VEGVIVHVILLPVDVVQHLRALLVLCNLSSSTTAVQRSVSMMSLALR
jgi:hypothetical protein